MDKATLPARPQRPAGDRPPSIPRSAPSPSPSLSTPRPSRVSSAGVAQRKQSVVQGSSTLSGQASRPSVVLSTAKLHITVGGCTAFYAAALSCAPDHAVTVSPSSLPTSIRVAPSLHVFSSHNWSTPQYFRVAAVGGAAAFDDAAGASRDGGGGGDRKPILQTIEHVSSSLDARFSGNRLLCLSPTLVVHVTPRDGAFVFTCGRALATATHVGKVAAKATCHHAFQPLEIDPGGTNTWPHAQSRATGGSLLVGGELVARSSVVLQGHQTPGGAAAVAAVDAANVATRRAAARRSVLLSTSTGLDAPPASDGFLSTPKDSQSFIKVACRKNQTALLQRNGQLVVLGRNDGDASAPKTHTASGDTDVALVGQSLTDIECGDDHLVAITELGCLLTWGDGRDGRLGHGGDGDGNARRASPTLLWALRHKRVVQVACGARHTLALAEDGDVFAWGDGTSGALGLSTSAQSRAPVASVATPMEVLTLKRKGVAKLACGDHHSAAVLVNGTLLTCGRTEHGRLGRGRGASTDEYSSCFAPVNLSGGLCTFVSCGGAHTLVLTACRTVYAFGCNSSGQLGLGDCRHRWAPTQVAYFGERAEDKESQGVLTVTSVAAGKLHSLAATQDARVFAWGSDEFGQCGVGTFPQIYTVPHLVPSAVGLGVTQVAGGDNHSVVLGHATQRHLDALESNYPLRYAALLDRFELFVREDKARRSRVLGVARLRQLSHDAAVRQRKPLVDPMMPRGVEWQKTLQEAKHVANSLVENGSPARSRRPQTRLAAGGAGEKKMPRVRCSSATLWRQTRLFSFQPSNEVANPLQLTPQAKQSLGRIFDDDEVEREDPVVRLNSDRKRPGDTARFSAA